MRIWDIDPGYLNRQSLLGEHRELHGMVSIFVNGRRGYSNHPETLRWVGRGWALRQRHRLLAAEMTLRGYHDRSPVSLDDHPQQWPASYIDPPAGQFRLLAEKYRDKQPGRIPLPSSAQQLWAQHKYSVMARSPASYQAIGREVATAHPDEDFAELARRLVALLRTAPAPGGVRNAVQHMWGYVSAGADAPKGEIDSWPLSRLFEETRRLAMQQVQPYLLHSTALGELGAWLPAD